MNPHTDPELIARSGVQAASNPLVVVSNRLPISLEVSGLCWSSQPSTGGLASALAGFQKDARFRWVGWPGHVVSDQIQAEIRQELGERGLIPVFLDEKQEKSYYRGFCNQVLWPLFHYFTDKVALEGGYWEHYVEVNRLFADATLAACGDDSRVWIHDFHLMLLPAMLRRLRPNLEIGFFLHIPWPSSEIFRLLPNRERILRGLLGADYVAFHTNEYAHHFRTSCLRVLGLESDLRGIPQENRRVGVGRHPIGIDTQRFREIAQREQTRKLREELVRRYGGRKLILGVERLDYSKGISLKLQAFERFLSLDPDRASRVTLLQVLVPSRMNHPEYQELRSEIEQQIGRINGKYGKPGLTPIEYMHRSLTPEQLVALYQVADVGLVTPIRDGMNLIAEEFVLCQEEGSGILILSEFAGAAQCLGGSFLVNPWDVEKTAEAIEEALAIDPRDRDHRMQAMVKRVEAIDCKIWAEEFLEKMHATAKQSSFRNTTMLSGDEIDKLARRFTEAPSRILILDYDGTLRELAISPEMASPTGEIMRLLDALSSLPETEVHVVSGRTMETLGRWLGDLPVHLSAEHGTVSRSAGRVTTISEQTLDLSWMPKVRQILEDVSREVPGTMVEEKRFSLAWHYRMADLDYGLWRARELLSSLESELSNQGAEVLSGHKVIEVRAAGVNKGNYVAGILEDAADDTMILCIGDDRTDEDMYRILPAGAVTVHVGRAVENAAYTIESPAKVRHVLKMLLDACASSGLTCRVPSSPRQ